MCCIRNPVRHLTLFIESLSVIISLMKLILFHQAYQVISNVCNIATLSLCADCFCVFTIQMSTGVHQCKPAHITWHCLNVSVLTKWKTILKITGKYHVHVVVWFFLWCFAHLKMFQLCFSTIFISSIFIISSCVLLFSFCSFSQATVFGPHWASLYTSCPSGFHQHLHQEPEPYDMCKCH